METYTIATTAHGRYLVSRPADGDPTLMLVGFHGQSETAATEMTHLEAIRGDRPWLLVSVQALNRYYTRSGAIVAAWMTREDRELAIADNIAYVGAVVDAVRSSVAAPSRLAYAGFSQGTAMAYRAAAFGRAPCDALVILAGDVPPDVAPQAARLPPVLLGRGTGEPWYTAERAQSDLDCLRGAGASVTECVFEGGHERVPIFAERARAFLDAVLSAR